MGLQWSDLGRRATDPPGVYPGLDPVQNSHDHYDRGEQITHDPLYGFPEGRKERGELITMNTHLTTTAHAASYIRDTLIFID